MQTDADNVSLKHVSRRGFVVMSGIASFAAGVAASPATAQSETGGGILAQPTASPTSDENTSDILVEALIDWGATHVFGIAGDGINPIVEALRKRQDRIAFVSVRHEEEAAFMATAFAKHSGRLGVCLATTGPGGFAMLMAELSAAVLYKRDVKVLVFNNDAYGEVKFEQRELGNPEYGTAIGHIDFAIYAEAVGARGFRASTLDDLRPAMRAWLARPARPSSTCRWTPRKRPPHPTRKLSEHPARMRPQT